MYEEKLDKDYAVVKCFGCGGGVENLIFKWNKIIGHGDTAYDGLCVYCKVCNIGVGNDSNYGDVDLMKKTNAVNGWNKFMLKFKKETIPENIIPDDSPKRMFQVLDEMNLDDVKNETRTVELANTFVSANLSKAGAEITMGAPATAIFSIEQGLKIPILVLVDKKEYFKRKK